MVEAARLEEVSQRLEESARRLRAGGLGADEATRLVEECAELASQAAIELDRIAKSVPAGPVPGQEELL